MEAQWTLTHGHRVTEGPFRSDLEGLSGIGEGGMNSILTGILSRKMIRSDLPVERTFWKEAKRQKH